VRDVRDADFSAATAVVTGAGAGLGLELARQLAGQGARVVIADIDGQAAKRAAAQIHAEGGTALAVAADVRSVSSVDGLRAATVQAFGPASLLINNAGIETLGRAWELSDADWHRTLKVNVLGTVNCVNAFMPDLVASGSGLVANVCSIGALLGMGSQAAYVTSKHAQLAYSECLALDLAAEGLPVRVCAVLPGPVKTGIFDSAGAQGAEGKAHQALMRQMLDEHGMTAQAAAAQILKGLASGQFWVSSHPADLAEAAAKRGAWLAGLNPPQPRQR